MRKRRRLDLKKTLFLLPNLITLSAVFCGFDSIHVSSRAQSEDDFYRAALLIVFAMFFDMLDGRVARMTKTQSAFGLQIDSLADVISFGVAPSVLVYQWTLHRYELAGLLVAFLFTACAVIRLARFNVLAMGEEGKPTKPSKYFAGLPTPGAAGILVSLVVADNAVAGAIGQPEHAWAIFAITGVLGLLMVSAIRFRSFKDLRLNVPTALVVAFAVSSSAIVSTQIQPAFVLVWLLGVYVLLGIFESLWMLPARLRAARDSAPPPAA